MPNIQKYDEYNDSNTTNEYFCTKVDFKEHAFEIVFRKG